MFPLVPIKAETLAVCMHDSLMSSLIYSRESNAKEQMQSFLTSLTRTHGLQTADLSPQISFPPSGLWQCVLRGQWSMATRRVKSCLISQVPCSLHTKCDQDSNPPFSNEILDSIRMAQRSRDLYYSVEHCFSTGYPLHRHPLNL